MELLKKAIWKLIDPIANLLLPEEKNIKEFLDLTPSELQRCLPKAEAISDRLTFPIFSYRNKKVRDIIWSIKYKGHKRITAKVSSLMYEEIMSLVEDDFSLVSRSISLVPVPISRLTGQERGFNQCLLLCQEIAKLDPQKIKVLDILEKVRDTGHQTALGRRERLQNMRNSMRVKEGVKNIQNINLIIIDDVYTTGATISEARRALEKIGPGGVLAITIAH